MTNSRESEQRIQDLEAEVKALKAGIPRGIRKRANFEILGLPAYDIALGPDPATGSQRGHAKGFLAIGDLATGVIAIGGLARGLFAFGGAAIGVFSLGGFSLGLALAFGGCALGGVAFGGAAGGGVAVGGGAAGIYAMGGGAVGTHVLSSTRRDPEAEAFFKKWGVPLPQQRYRR